MTMNYSKAHDKFRRCRDKRNGAVVDRHTHIRSCGRDAEERQIYELTYHNTSLVRWFADGKVAVRTAGWHTLTTSRRIRAYARVSPEKYAGERVFTNYREDALYPVSMILDTDEWAVLHRTDEGRTFWKGHDGQPVKGVLWKCKERPRPAHRNPLTKLCRGDVLVDPDGRRYIAAPQTGSQMWLLPYYGDVVQGVARVSWPDHIDVTNLFALSLSVGGWTVGKRFMMGEA